MPALDDAILLPQWEVLLSPLVKGGLTLATALRAPWRIFELRADLLPPNKREAHEQKENSLGNEQEHGLD